MTNRYERAREREIESEGEGESNKLNAFYIDLCFL